MRIILGSGFDDPRINALSTFAQIDQKELEHDNKAKLNKVSQVLAQNYKEFQRIIGKLNLNNEEQVKLPEFNIQEFIKTGKISRELYNLFEYGNPFLGIPPRKLMSKLKI